MLASRPLRNALKTDWVPNKLVVVHERAAGQVSEWRVYLEASAVTLVCTRPVLRH